MSNDRMTKQSRLTITRRAAPNSLDEAMMLATDESIHGRKAMRPRLSRREQEVLIAWLRAESKAEAAAMLFLSIGTINTHITRIRAKYAAVERPAATKMWLLVRALQDGFTRLEDW